MYNIIDADVKNYFGNINHGQLREFLDLRGKDGVVHKMIDNIAEGRNTGRRTFCYPKEVTPRGEIISPLLSNIYIHYVLDAWLSEELLLRLIGRNFGEVTNRSTRTQLYVLLSF